MGWASKVISRYGRVVALVLGCTLPVSLLYGCAGSLDPCPGVGVGVKYRLEMGASPSCAAAWGFAEGTQIAAEIVEVDGRDECNSGRATMVSDSGWKLDLKSDQSAAGGALLEGHYSLSRDNCVGEAWVGLGCDSGCLRAGGSSCMCSMSINAQSLLSGCPPTCRVSLPVSATRL